VLLVLLSVGALGGGSYLAWRNLKTRILDSPEYLVDVGKVEITPLPDWIHSDIRAEVFCDPRLDGRLSIMDDDLVDRIKRTFEDHPWVARVVRVAKRHPASVEVELEYRRPVCMVEAPGGVYAVDAEGVVLPSGDFSPVEATRYPRLTGVDRAPTAPVGRHWSDARVIGGAEIAAVLSQCWEAMKLHRIVPLESDPTTAVAAAADAGRRFREPFFALITRGGTRILWGYAPRANGLGEIPAAEKVARLKRYLATYDSFDDPRAKQRDLDVRAMSKE